MDARSTQKFSSARETPDSQVSPTALLPEGIMAAVARLLAVKVFTKISLVWSPSTTVTARGALLQARLQGLVQEREARRA